MINFLKSLEVNYDVVVEEMNDVMKMRINGVHTLILTADTLIANGTTYQYPASTAEFYRIFWLENITLTPKK